MKPHIYFNSVFFTPEGITKHAREEAKELLKRGYSIFITDSNYSDLYGEEFKSMYSAVDREKVPTIHYMIQPPYRPHNIPLSLAGHMKDKNVIYFLAFEAALPAEWTQIINRSNCRVVIVPSTYNKKVFEKSGIIKNIEIVPHGVDESFSFEDKKPVTPEFNILWAGTVHNDRKGLKYMWRAWEEIKKQIPSATLTLKVSTIYGVSERNKLYLSRAENDPRVKIITKVLTDGEVAELFKNAHVYVSPHLSEGFGIHMLEALATGTPTICSDWGGNIDFSRDHCFNLKPAEEFIAYEEPYHGEKWSAPSVGDIVDSTIKLFNEYDTYKEIFKMASERIHKQYSWSAIVDKLEGVFKKYYRT